MARGLDYSKLSKLENNLKCLWFATWYKELNRQCTVEEYNWALKKAEEFAAKKAIELKAIKEIALH